MKPEPESWEEIQRRSFESTAGRLFSRPFLVASIWIFVAVSAAGIAASFLWSAGGDLWPTLLAMRPSLLGILGLLVLCDWVLGALRLYIFAHPMSPSVGFWDSMRANLANMFLGGITPTQTGGGAAQLYILWRAGLPFSSGVAFTVINFVSTLATLVLAVGFIVLATPAEFPPLLRLAIRYGFLVCTLALGLLLATLLAPRFFARFAITLIEKAARFLGPVGRRRALGLREKLDLMIRDWHEAVRLVSRERPYLLVLSQVLTFALYFNKCLIGYVLAQAMGIVAPFWSILGAQAVVVFLCYFSPTPGGAFVAEVSNSFLMGFVSGRESMALHTTLVRISAMWLGVILGGFVLAQQLRKDSGLLLPNAHPLPPPGPATPGSAVTDP